MLDTEKRTQTEKSQTLRFERLALFLLSYRIRERIPNDLRRILHENVVADARSGSANLPCDSRIAVILIVKLMHQDQLVRRHSCSHSLLGGLGGTRRGLQLRVGMSHRFAPAFVDVSAEGLDLRVRAAEFLDHAVDLFQLCGVVPRNGDGLLVGIQNNFHANRPLFRAFLRKRCC